MSEPRVPTVDDLRVGTGSSLACRLMIFTVIQQVKMCYICREEERYDGAWLGHLPWSHSDLTTCSSYPGENEVDTPMSMHPYRSWCGAKFLFASGRKLKRSCPARTRILPASLDPKFPRKPVPGRESLQMPTVWRGLRDRERQPPASEGFEQIEWDVDEDGENRHLSRYGDHCLHIWNMYVFPNSVAREFTLTFPCSIGTTGIYLLCTSYGAWAVREFLGPEM